MLFYLKTIGIGILMILGFIGVLLSTLLHFAPNNPPSTLLLLGVGVASITVAFLCLVHLVNYNQRPTLEKSADYGLVPSRA